MTPNDHFRRPLQTHPIRRKRRRRPYAPATSHGDPHFARILAAARSFLPFLVKTHLVQVLVRHEAGVHATLQVVPAQVAAFRVRRRFGLLDAGDVFLTARFRRAQTKGREGGGKAEGVRSDRRTARKTGDDKMESARTIDADADATGSPSVNA
uniref:Uncharacterized protein n=1 Tax=Corethron hystrix TaxID=216773 RepID=A0A7S1BYE7_9STRA